MRFSGTLRCEKAYYAAFQLKEIQNQWFHLCWYGICTYLTIWTNRGGPIALDGYVSMCVCACGQIRSLACACEEKDRVYARICACVIIIFIAAGIL